MYIFCSQSRNLFKLNYLIYLINLLIVPLVVKLKKCFSITSLFLRKNHSESTMVIVNNNFLISLLFYILSNTYILSYFFIIIYFL